MTGAPLSNRVTHLAERTDEEFCRGNARTIKAADYPDCGRPLAEA